MYAALGIVSVGVLAGLAYLWRQQGATTEQKADESSTAGANVVAAAEEELSEEDALAAMEPAPAT